MKSKFQVLLSLAAAAVVCFTPPATAHEASANKSKTSVKQSGWVKAAKKPHGSDIDLRYRYVNAKPHYAVGETVTIELELTGARSSDAGFELRQDKALTMASAGLSKTTEGFRSNLTKAKRSLSVSLTPQSEGLHYLYVQTSQEGKGSVAAIPVRVGDKPLNLPTTGELKTLPDGRKIIEMKAQ